MHHCAAGRRNVAPQDGVGLAVVAVEHLFACFGIDGSGSAGLPQPHSVLKPASRSLQNYYSCLCVVRRFRVFLIGRCDEWCE